MIPKNLTEADRELFEERAAIREYDGRMPRQAAERGARQDVERWRPEFLADDDRA
jgi:hypothetical protein